MIKLKDLLSESQTFDIGRHKSEIIRTIDRIRSGGKLFSGDHSTMYEIITNMRLFGDTGILNRMGYTEDDSKRWKEFFDKSSLWNTGGGWSQRNINPDKKVKVDGKSYNYYITIDRNDKNNVMLFLNKIKGDGLSYRLQQFADKRGVAISYKTHAILRMFLTHNDSLKVYYYDSSFKNDIESIVKKWVSDNNIKISDRSHTHGVDMNGKSYGEIVAATVLNTLVDTIKSHPNHSNEEYYQWLVKHFIDIIKNIKVK